MVTLGTILYYGNHTIANPEVKGNFNRPSKFGKLDDPLLCKCKSAILSADLLNDGQQHQFKGHVHRLRQHRMGKWKQRKRR